MLFLVSHWGFPGENDEDNHVVGIIHEALQGENVMLANDDRISTHTWLPYPGDKNIGQAKDCPIGVGMLLPALLTLALSLPCVQQIENGRFNLQRSVGAREESAELFTGLCFPSADHERRQRVSRRFRVEFLFLLSNGYDTQRNSAAQCRLNMTCLCGIIFGIRRLFQRAETGNDATEVGHPSGNYKGKERGCGI